MESCRQCEVCPEFVCCGQSRCQQHHQEHQREAVNAVHQSWALLTELETHEIDSLIDSKKRLLYAYTQQLAAILLRRQQERAKILTELQNLDIGTKARVAELRQKWVAFDRVLTPLSVAQRILMRTGSQEGQQLAELKKKQQLNSPSIEALLSKAGFNLTYAVNLAASIQSDQVRVQFPNDRPMTFEVPRIDKHSRCIATSADCIVITGGEEGSLAVKLTLSSQQVVELPALTISRQKHSMSLLNGGPVVIGGEHTTTETASVEIFTGRQWEPCPSLNLARKEHSSTHHKDRVYVVGGTAGCDTLRCIEVLSEGNWVRYKFRLPEPIKLTGVICINEDSLVVMGGCNVVSSKLVHLISPNQTRRLEDLPQPQVFNTNLWTVSDNFIQAFEAYGTLVTYHLRT